MFSAFSIRSSIRSTASLAPPCSGPYSAPIPAAQAEYGSTSDEPTSRTGGRRAVLLVVRVQDPQHVERTLETGVGLVLDLRHPVHHREEVAGVGQVVVGID